MAGTEAGDYEMIGLTTDGKLTIAKDSDWASFTVRAMPDPEDTEDEMINLYFGDLVSAGLVAGSPATATVNLDDGHEGGLFDDRTETLEEVSKDIPVLSNDSAVPPGTTPTVTITTYPQHGIDNVDDADTVTVNDGIVTYDPPLNFNGEVKFTYQVADITQTVTVVVQVGPVNDPPTAKTIGTQNLTVRKLGERVESADDTSIEVKDYFDDVDNSVYDGLTFTATSQDEDIATIEWRNPLVIIAEGEGTTVVEVTGKDPGGQTDVLLIPVNVKSVSINRPPHLPECEHQSLSPRELTSEPAHRHPGRRR